MTQKTDKTEKEGGLIRRARRSCKKGEKRLTVKEHRMKMYHAP